MKFLLLNWLAAATVLLAATASAQSADGPPPEAEKEISIQLVSGVDLLLLVYTKHFIDNL